MKKITVVGAGTMGNGIAHVFAQNNYTVNLVDISQMIIDSASHRKESRGAHYNVNYPHKRKTVKDTLIRKSVMSDVI